MTPVKATYDLHIPNSQDNFLSCRFHL
jgi:hypothetical protein